MACKHRLPNFVSKLRRDEDGVECSLTLTILFYLTIVCLVPQLRIQGHQLPQH